MIARVSVNVWIMWFLASVFYAYQYVLRVLPNIIMPELMSKFQIDAAVFGQFSGLYYLGYAGMHIPIGLMLDRLGPRIVMTVSILCTVLGMMPLIFSDVWIYPSLGRVLIGMGSSGAILGVFKVIRMGFPESHFTRMLGVSVTIGLLGAIYGGQPVQFLLQSWGWEATLKMIGLAGLILAAAIYFVLPAQDSQKINQGNIWGDLKALCSKGKVFLICILGGLMVGPLEGFADAWGTSFLKTVYDLNEGVAAGMPSFMFLGMCFGAPIIGYLAEKMGSYFAMILICAVLMAAAFLYLLFGHPPSSILPFLFSFVGVLCAYQIIVIYKATTYVPERLAAVTNALANMIIMTFGYFFHATIGGVMTYMWTGEMIADRPLYSAQLYTYGLSVIPMTLMIAALGYVVLWYRELRSDAKVKITA